MNRPHSFLVLPLLFLSLTGFGQATNLRCTSAQAEKVMLGLYNPSVYYSGQEISAPDTIAGRLLKNVHPDSLRNYIIRLAAFKNRNSGADTNSNLTGMGAARRWIYNKFSSWSASSPLIPAYFSFDQSICGIGSHKNVMAVLPGTDTTDNSIILIEGHMDSRCEGLCDTSCIAQGVEDNASGTALTMELARVMSGMRFKRTVVFLITTAEEQGLYGAEAFADYVQNKGIRIRAVQNNDVIGGIICGATASSPGCSGQNSIDSTQVRLFSSGGFNSKHKQFARFVKLQYKKHLLQPSPVKMQISVMSPEDRTGRGGDHIPFRQHAYTAIRFTSANEHGNANVSLASYSDRQHSTRDTLGVDTDGNALVDSFFVDFNYLGRNSCINGMAAAVAASGPLTPDFTCSYAEGGKIAVSIAGEGSFRVGIRTLSNDWDSVYTISQAQDTIEVSAAAKYYVSVAAIGQHEMESLFSKEITLSPTGIPKKNESADIELLPNRPNPFDESTIISLFAGAERTWKSATLRITDASGKLLSEIPLDLHEGLNEVWYEHGYQVQGVLDCTLMLDGKPFSSRKMVFAN